MAKLVNWVIFSKQLKDKGLRLFTPLDIRRIFGISKVAATFLLHRYTRRGLILRLKTGLYTLSDANLPEFYLANNIYKPSYVSFDTALSFHDLIPETIYSITSATPKATREFESMGIHYHYRRIKKEAFCGYQPISLDGQIVLLAEPEKALADYLYFIDLGKRTFSYERLDLAKIKKAKLQSYLKLFNRPSMIELVEKIYDQSRQPQRIF